MSYRDGELRRGTRELNRKTRAAIRDVFDQQAPRGEAYMKEHAPWTDRTGAARATLSTTTHYPRNQYVLIFAHGVYYGIWLEVSNSGDYQVIMPSVRAIGHDINQQLNGLFRKVR